MSGCAAGRSEAGFNGDCDDGEGKGTEIAGTECGREQKKESKKDRVFGRYNNGFRKFQRFLSRASISSCSSSSPSCSVSHKNSDLSSGRSRFGGGLSCCSCLCRTDTLEKNLSRSNGDPNLSRSNGDPNTPAVHGYQYLRSMIEGNDFYSEGCKTHFGD